MRLLHTSDWHLGHHLCEKKRTEEHSLFLNWLINRLKEDEIDVLIISGDIFDTAYPPNFALEQYYNFLRQVAETRCYDVIVAGGNHDAPSTLNAPRDLLKYLRIHVVGKAEQDPALEVIPVKDNTDKVIGIVCAVPFLRTRDVKKAIAGETYQEKEKAIIQGISHHYLQILEKANTLKKELNYDVPIIATGHLFTLGGIVSDSVRDIYVGNLGQVGSDIFPKDFEYVALGHLHNCQKVNKKNHIRYSGSPIPLSFSEANSEKYVLIADFNQKNLINVDQVSVPYFRRLLCFKGNLDEIKTQLINFEGINQNDFNLTAWAEIQVENEHFDPSIHDKVMAMAEGKSIEILKIINKFNQTKIWQENTLMDLDEFKPDEVFLKKCEIANIDDSKKEELLSAFNELLSEMNEV
ncbi:DNA repair protein SbcD/Mre11 [Candidatus Magnetomoraceae bacterium gMMP-15]